MLTPKQQEALDEIIPCAIAVERKTSFPAEALVAQWAVESGWGQKVTGDFNYFGLTRQVAPDRPMKWCATHEILTEAQLEQLEPEERARVTSMERLPTGKFNVRLSRRFPSFDSIRQAVDRYVLLLTQGYRYARAWTAYLADHDLDKLLNGIAAAGYSTSGNYALVLRQIAHGHNVAIAVQVARQKG